MKRLEIIELRTAGGNGELLELQLQKLIRELGGETKKQAIKIYGCALINTDFSIHLFHDSKKAGNGGSPLGLYLTSALKEFGLVNHCIWIETQST